MTPTPDNMREISIKRELQERRPGVWEEGRLRSRDGVAFVWFATIF